MASPLLPRSTSTSPSPTTSSFPSSFNDSGTSNDDAAAPASALTGDGHKRDHDDTKPTASTMPPRPSSPVAKTLEEQMQEQDEQELVDADGERPQSPVAKALLSQSSSVLEDDAAADAKPGGSTAGEEDRGGSIIPNLLSSGRFPPPPHSPRRNFSPRLSSGSPPTIVSSPGLASPGIPAAPPSTPYTPMAAAAGGSVVPGHHPSLPLTGAASSLPAGYSLNTRPSSPPLIPNNVTGSPFASPSATRPTAPMGNVQPPKIPPISPGSVPPLDPHYNALLNQALHETTEREKARIASLTEHEAQNYTTIEEYKHALSRERRHATSLAVELTHYKFLTKYTSCSVYSAAEINEEAHINALLKGIDTMKSQMNEDRCRVVMELEREEERIINGLVMRLEEVEREKRLLERQIESVRSTGGAGGMDGEEQRLHASFERLMAAGRQPQQTPTVPPQAQPDVTTADGGAEKQGENSNNMQEDSDEAEEVDEGNEDILEGRYHDPDMEEELANLLKMKESK